MSGQRPHHFTQLRTPLTRVQERAPHESHYKVCSLAENFNEVFWILWRKHYENLAGGKFSILHVETKHITSNRGLVIITAWAKSRTCDLKTTPKAGGTISENGPNQHLFCLSAREVAWTPPKTPSYPTGSELYFPLPMTACLPSPNRKWGAPIQWASNQDKPITAAAAKEGWSSKGEGHFDCGHPHARLAY